MPIARGTLLGPYEVLQLLGRGGMGEVYRARDTKLGRDVAVKVLSAAEAQSASALVRFEQEARAASALNHPSILTILDIGSEGGVPYLAMELVDGPSLDAVLASGPLPLRRALSIAQQVADGLAKAHHAGIVHRDLKPENVMVTSDGRAKVVDFGLAKLLGESSEAAHRLTRTGFVVGTAAYMSPEQARGQRVDYRSDQFALGSLLYEMLTGAPAFSGPSVAQTMTSVIEAEPPGLSLLARRVPPAVVAILERCLSKDPAGRFGDTQELADLLQRAAEEAGRTKATVTLAPARGRRVHPGLLAALAAVLLAVGLVSGYALGRARVPPPPRLEPLTHSGADTEPAASPDGSHVAFVSARDGLPRVWMKQLASGAEAPLTTGPDASPRFSPSGADVAFVRHGERSDILCRVPVLGGQPLHLLDDVAAADWTPDGRSLVFVRWRNEGGRPTSEVGRVGADGADPRILARVPGAPLVHPRISPDGRTVALTVNGLQSPLGALVALDLETRLLSPLVPADPSAPHHSSVSWLRRKGRFLVARSLSRTAFVVNQNRPAELFLATTGESRRETVLWTPSFGFVQDVLPDGRLVLEARSVRGSLVEVSFADPGRRRALTRGTLADRQPVYSPDGRRLLFASNRSGNWDVWELDLAVGSLRNLMGHPADDWDPAFASGGRSLLWSSNRSGSFEIWTANADGSGARRLTTGSGDAQNPSMTRDGAFVVYASASPEREGVWRLPAAGGPPTRIVAGRAQLPEVSPDGVHAAFVTGDKGRVLLRVVRVADGAPVPFEIDVGPERSSDRGLGRPRWTADGTALAFIAPGADGRRSVFAQDFAPGEGTAATRRLLLAPDPGAEIETFGIAADGTRLCAELVEPVSSLLLATGVRGVDRSRASLREGPFLVLSGLLD